MSSRTVVIPHVGRVEGHGGIFVRIEGKRVARVEMDIFEGSRYFEALLKGKHFQEVQGIVTRVCAICSASHTVTALQALEQALGLTVSERVHDLRGLLLLGATIESHALHVFALALPDFLGYESVLTMAKDYNQEVVQALRLKQLGNKIQELIGGRAVHPVNTLVGGFGKLPQRKDLEVLIQELEASLPILERFVDLAASLSLPDYQVAPTVYIALRPYQEAFRFRGVSLCTSQGQEYPLETYREVIREFTVEHSHAKHAALAEGTTYMVGSLARLRLWGHYLTGRARAAYERFFLDKQNNNPLLNNWAQLVELIHSVERAREICQQLLNEPEEREDLVPYQVRSGRGIGAIEAPRGTLFHEYELDRNGRVVAASVITPTAQNLANLERDMRANTEAVLERNDQVSDRELKLMLEMLARAYDPCISCSVHLARA